MFKITVTNRKGFVVAIYFNENRAQGLAQARMTHGLGFGYRVEAA